MPRNLDRPGYFANYGLLPDADARLTEWMHAHLTIAVWAAPANLDPRLKDLEKLEKAIIVAWEPPLNLRGAPRPSPRLKAARKVMAAEAAHWAAQHRPTAAITTKSGRADTGPSVIEEDTGSPRTGARQD